MEAENVEDTIKEDLEEGIQHEDPLSCEHYSDEDNINDIDIVDHKIEI